MTQILVIEDELILRNEIVDMLTFEGFSTLSAADGEAGLELARKHQPDLILCDITMPKMNGYEVLAQVREAPESALTPFIFLSARADRPFMRHGMELGADDYLTKPFTHAELLAAINTRLVRQGELDKARDSSLEQAKLTLSQMVTHELRSPLVSIMMVQEIISRQLGQLSVTQMQDLLDSLQSSSKRMAHLVEQMVYVTQFDAGLLSPERLAEEGQPVEVWQMLTASVDLGRRFAISHQNSPIRLQDRDRNAVVIGNMPALKHALAELIANALHFSPEHKEIVISQWQSGASVWISIVDEGCGIPPSQLERVFEEFHQVNRQIQEQQGIGLGLSLSHRIILAHRGTFELNSVENKGTQVTLSLPTA